MSEKTHPIVTELGIEIDAGISDVLFSLDEATPDELRRAVAAWMDSAAQFCRNEAYWRDERARPAEDRIERALKELGVPGEGYPAPVANAVDILSGTEKCSPTKTCPVPNDSHIERWGECFVASYERYIELAGG